MQTSDLTDHISKRFNADLEELRNKVLAMGGLVETQLSKAISAIVTGDSALGLKVANDDYKVNKLEVTIDEECSRILATRAPAASDLRLIVAIIKTITDLERIGDLAAGIAKQGRYLAGSGSCDVPYDLVGMAVKVRRMLRDSLDALTEKDAAIAHRVCEADDEVDAMDRLMYQEIRAAIRETPEKTEGLIRLQRVSQNLERIADHATNIAEDVIYLVEGEIIRHTSPLNNGS